MVFSSECFSGLRPEHSRCRRSCVWARLWRREAANFDLSNNVQDFVSSPNIQSQLRGKHMAFRNGMKLTTSVWRGAEKPCMMSVRTHTNMYIYIKRCCV